MSSLQLCEHAHELCARVHCKFGSDVTATLIELQYDADDLNDTPFLVSGGEAR